jgi:hypothetical protein
LSDNWACYYPQDIPPHQVIFPKPSLTFVNSQFYQTFLILLIWVCHVFSTRTLNGRGIVATSSWNVRVTIWIIGLWKLLPIYKNTVYLNICT